jgi:hypothetical protein
MGAGWAYAPLGILMPLWGKKRGQERQKLEATLAPPPSAAIPPADPA